VSSEVEWKIVSTLSRYILSQDDLGQGDFNARPNPGFFRQFSVPLKYAYVPLVLEPATGYYNYIHQCADKSGHPFKEKKAPFHVSVPGVTSARFTLNFRLYPPNILATTIRLQSLEEEITGVPFDALFSLRKPRSIPILRDLIRWSVDLISGRQVDDPAVPLTETFAGYHFAGVESDYWTNDKNRLVGLLVGNRYYDEMDPDIVNRVISKSAELNRKSIHEYIMVNKQGTLYFSVPQAGSSSNRLHRAMDLAELAMVYKSFLDNVYPERRDHEIEDLLDYRFTRVRAWIERPDAILSVSYTNTLHWKLLATEFSLSKKLDLLQAENQWLSQVLADKSEQFASMGVHGG
jgi:hypothetical protein